MVILLVILLALLLAFFIFALVADASQPKQDTPKESAVSRSANNEIERYKKRCFETYREYQIEEQKYRLYRQVFCDRGIFHYIQELFAFRIESLNRKMKGDEYKSKVLDVILTPLRETLHTSFPYIDSCYHVPEHFDMFLTPNEYYEQQLSYRTTASDTAASEAMFWRGRLSRNDENMQKLQTDPANAFFLKLWLSCKPLLEEAETIYRSELLAASNRDTANQLTKDLLERIEETLFRCGIVILRYENANEFEQVSAFSPAGPQTEAPAIIREKDGLVYEKGRKN